MDELLTNGSTSAKWTLILAHGAGAGMRTPFMDVFAEGLADKGLRVVRFEFPYMRSGKRGAPDREPVLREAWHQVIKATKAKKIAIGGKSMGGRIASMVADEAKVDALVCLGYPFHPAGRTQQLRVAHLKDLQTPTLIVQGERDTMGTRAEVESYALSPKIQIYWSVDGDHSLKPRKSSGHTEASNWQAAIEAIAEFLKEQAS